MNLPARKYRYSKYKKDSYPFADVIDQECRVGFPVVKWDETVVRLLPCSVPYLKAKRDITQMHHPGQVGT